MVQKLIFPIFYLIFISILNLFIYSDFVLNLGDNFVKYLQAKAVIENHYKSDKYYCLDFSEFEYCRFHPLPENQAVIRYDSQNNYIYGVFPVALSYISAIIIDFLDERSIILISEILFFLVLYILWLNKYLDNLNLIFLFIASPLLIQFIVFFDVALAIFFSSFSFIYLANKDKTNSYIIVLSGILTGLAFFFRIEYLIYYFIWITLLLIYDKLYQRKHFLFFTGIMISLVIIFLINYFYYGNVFGLRFESNRISIFSFSIREKFNVLYGLLWGINRIGFFKFMPYIILIFIFMIMNFYKEESIWRIHNLSVILAFITISFLSPNDANVDYGSRYLSIIIIPVFIYFQRIREIYKYDYKKFIIYFLLLLSIYANYKYIARTINIIKNSVFLYNQVSDFYKKNAIWIFFDHFSPVIFSPKIYKNKTVVLRSEEDVKEFIYLLERENLTKYKNIVLFKLIFSKEYLLLDSIKNSNPPYDLIKRRLSYNYNLISRQEIKDVKNKEIFELYYFQLRE